MDPNNIPAPRFDTAELKILFEQFEAENETISFLLKAHLFSEYHLDRLLAAYLGKKREPLDAIDLRFAQKLSLVDSFGLLPQSCIRSLRVLNKLRNKCVHNFDTRPSVEDVRQVTDELDPFVPRAESINSVPELLKAYMASLFGYVSASYDLSAKQQGA